MRRRRADLEAAHQILPERRDLLEGAVERGQRGVFVDQGPRRAQIGALAEEKGELPGLARRQLELDLEGEAGIEPGPGAAVQGTSLQQGRRPCGAAVAADEGGAIATDVDTRAGRHRPGESNAGGERAALGVARQQRSGLVRGGRNLARGRRGQAAQHQTREGEDADPAPPGAAIRELNAGDLERILPWHELADLLLELGTGLAEPAVAEAVAHRAGRRRDWPRGRRPEGARVLVAHIERLAMRIADRVVVPGREPVLAAVAGPGRGRHRSQRR